MAAWLLQYSNKSKVDEEKKMKTDFVDR